MGDKTVKGYFLCGSKDTKKWALFHAQHIKDSTNKDENQEVGKESRITIINAK